MMSSIQIDFQLNCPVCDPEVLEWVVCIAHAMRVPL
jgi:hypothetical protein